MRHKLMMFQTNFRQRRAQGQRHQQLRRTVTSSVTDDRPARRLANRLFALAAVAGGALLGWAPPCLAQFQVCNQTFDVINVAIGQEAGASGRAGVFQTEGWWTIGANRCVDVIKEELVNRYIYVFATDVFDQPVIDGTTEMCVAPKRFVIEGIDQCWQRGHKVARFMEVDTQAVQRWTLFLKDPLSN